MATELTAKQKKFADNYIETGNKYQSALEAGYSESYSKAISSQLTEHPKIKAYINEKMRSFDNKKIASQEEVLSYLTSVMRGESVSETVVVEGTGDGFSEAVRLARNPEEKDRIRAAELLGKRYGLYVDKVKADLDVDAELKISIDYGDSDGED